MDRVTEALAAAAAREAARTPAEQAKLDMMLLLAAHLFMCCPIETLEGGAKHKWHRDLQPPINGVGCRCKGRGMKRLGPNHFLRERELPDILSRMDIPAARHDDFRWLARNIAIRNSDHPELGRAQELMQERVA